MRVIQFPPRRGAAAEAAVLAELEAAFDGDGTGVEAEAWRELRADVRSLAAPIDPSFQRSLEGHLRGGAQGAGAPRLPRWRRGVRWPAGLALGGAFALVAALLLLSSGPGSNGTRSPSVFGSAVGAAPRDGLGSAAGASSLPAHAAPAKVSPESAAHQSGAHAPMATAGTVAPAPAGEAPGETSRRLQQLGASISLDAGSEGVQALADRIGRLAVAAGGFVESSKVELQRGTGGEATLMLKLPSTQLAQTLAKLQRLAPVRAETQSLRDLTGQYDAIGARLAAARAERNALLRALAKAETAAALESLHQRIAQADSAIAADERQRAGISHSASRAQVEVSVLGEAAHATGGLTLGRGLRDAGHILTVSLAVLLIALAVLIPLALLLGALLVGARGWRRQQRERALGPS